MITHRADGHPVVQIPRKWAPIVYWTRLTQRLRARLPQFVVYRPPTREYGPDKWVARLWVALPEPKPTRWVLTHDSLDELRSILPPGLVRIERSPDDHPSIEEVWL